MLPASLIAVAICGYVAALVIIGWRADRPVARDGKDRARAILYGLSLATLCSAWTYFGAVGDASNGSWLFAANALGPIIAITLGYPIWRRIAILAKQENVGSLADFLAARYGKSRALGILATLVSTFGALPYIALQITILTEAWSLATGSGAAGPWQALIWILVLAAIAIVFGARRPSLTQHNRGFVAMIAVESLVKLFGLLTVAGLCVVLIAGTGHGWSAALMALPSLSFRIDPSFVTLTLLCTVTAFTLPRQFHLGFVTLEDPADIRTAVWVVPLYFVAWSLATVIIATGIRAGFGMPGIDPYLQVLGLPMANGHRLLSLFALLGGLSAGAAMVIVETTAISAMVSNEIVLPLLVRTMNRKKAGSAVSSPILIVRRATILGIGLAAWLYFLGIRNVEGPTQLGQTALAAFAQLLPALVGGVFWRGGHARGAIAGIAAGTLVWATAIAAPAFLTTPDTGDAIFVLWPFSGSWSSELAIVGSLTINTALYIAISLGSRPRLIDTIQSNSFVSASEAAPSAAQSSIGATVGDLRRLLAQFLGEEEAQRSLLEFQVRTRTGILSEEATVTPSLARAAERFLAGTIGAPSARNVVAIALSADSQDAAEISRILDEAGHAVHFSRELLQTTLDALGQGVSVLDAGQRLVAWNADFLKLTGVPIERVHIGKPLDELLREGGAGEAEDALRSFIIGNWEELKRRQQFRKEVALADGRMMQVTGEPLGEDEYLNTFADITGLKQAEQVLARSNEELEQLVQERTGALVEANEALDVAKQTAEQATGAQRRLVAAASHDLVQPLHAARLFIGNALVGADEAELTTSLLKRADQAIEGAHRLLRALLNLSQLESGALAPKREPIDANELLQSLAAEFTEQCEGRSIELIVLPTGHWVRSDIDLLRSMLQNLLANAVRYTPKGRVVLALRRAGHADLRFEVRDAGIGISPDKLPEAFGEYSRLPEGRSLSEGAGLGLSIVSRIGRVLNHPVAVRSQEGRGSVFSVTVPLAQPVKTVQRKPAPDIDLRGLKVLCVDDEADVLDGATALIGRWGGDVSGIASAEEVDRNAPWQAVIADYHLGGRDGLSLLRELPPGTALRLLLTATPADLDSMALASEGIVLMQKPIAPLALRALLGSAAKEVSLATAARGQEPAVEPGSEHRAS